MKPQQEGDNEDECYYELNPGEFIHYFCLTALQTLLLASVCSANSGARGVNLAPTTAQ